MFLAAVWLFMFVFFYRVHPLVVLDADDWTYISYTRVAIPSPQYWNSSRILPEILLSACGSFSAFVLLPLVRDYISALTLTFALVLSSCVTVYTFCFVRLAEKKLSAERVWSLPAAVLFLLFHFLIFRTENSGNSYMFRSCNVCCTFYYTIPALLNASLLMFFMADGGADACAREGSPLKKGVLLLLCYLAVFSNLYESIILAAYAGVCALFALIDGWKAKRGLLPILREIPVSLGIVLLWAVSAVLELLGGRAESLRTEVPFGTMLSRSVANAAEVVRGTNVFFLLLLVGLVGFAVLTALCRRKKNGGIVEPARLFFLTVLTGILVTVFVILLGAKTVPDYIEVYRADLIFGMLFFPVLLMTLCGVYLLREQPWIRVLVPLLICVIATEINTPLPTFAEPNTIFTDPATVMAMSRDVVEQLVEADRAGMTHADIYVSDSGSGDNWPQAVYMGQRVVNSLRKHGILAHDIEVTIVPSQEYNEKFNIFPEE